MMLKMYLQLMLTLGSFFSFVLSSLWLTMTYIYANKILEERGTAPVYNWWLIYSVIAVLILSVIAFIVGVVWVRNTKAKEREKMMRYRILVTSERKETAASF